VKSIGFIGVGIMGKSMVRNLMKRGFEVRIHTRTKEKALDVIGEGAVWCDSIRECAAGRDVVITIVGYPKDVKEVYFGPQGILESADKGATVIDMTTTSPTLSVQICDAAKEKGLYALDAPVTGGDVGARQGTLSIFVGGDREAFDACLPVLEAMGRNIVYQGGAGKGQHAKMANQIMIAGTVAGLSEALAYARRNGLDLQTLLDALKGGGADSWQLQNYAPRILKGDFAPGFFIKHFIKDMTIANEEAGNVSLDLSVLKAVLAMYKELEKDGKGELGTQALIRHYDA